MLFILQRSKKVNKNTYAKKKLSLFSANTSDYLLTKHKVLRLLY